MYLEKLIIMQVNTNLLFLLIKESRDILNQLKLKNVIVLA